MVISTAKLSNRSTNRKNELFEQRLNHKKKSLNYWPKVLLGSDFFLLNLHLTASYKKGFDTVFSELTRPTAALAVSADSLCERVAGIEPA